MVAAPESMVKLNAVANGTMMLITIAVRPRTLRLRTRTCKSRSRPRTTDQDVFACDQEQDKIVKCCASCSHEISFASLLPVLYCPHVANSFCGL